MHILFISNAFPRPNEPGTSQPWQMVTHWIKKNYRISVITNMRHYMSDYNLSQKSEFKFIKKIKEQGMIIYEVLTPRGRRKSIFRRIINYFSFSLLALFVGLKVKNIDIVYVRTPPPLINFFGWLLTRLKGNTPYVLEIADLHPESAVSFGLIKSKLFIVLWEKWERFFYNKADLIVGIVPRIKKKLIKKGIPSTKIITITNAYDPPEEESYSIPTEINDLFDKKLKSKFIIIYAGTMALKENLETAIEAARIIQKKGYKNINFVYVGEGDKKKKLKEMCKKMFINNCIFCNPVPRCCIHNILARADVAFYCLYKDPFQGYTLPNKFFEYLGNGKAIIYAGTGDVAEIINDVKCGIVVPPEDPKAFAKAVIYLYTHKEEAKKMGLHGREYVLTHFNRERILEKLNKRLSKLI